MRASLDSERSEGAHGRDDDQSTPLLPQHFGHCAADWKDAGSRASFAASETGTDGTLSYDGDGIWRHCGHGPSDSPSTGDCAYSKKIRAHRRRHRLASLAYSSTLICFAISCILAAGVIGWVAHFLYMRQQAFSTAVFARPLIPEPVSVEPNVQPFAETTSIWVNATEGQWPRDDVESELARRFEQTLETSHPMGELACPDVRGGQGASARLAERYAPLREVGPSAARQGRTLLALNLYNSQDLLPALSQTLLSVAEYLGPSSVYVSIFENGSTDQTTVMLAHLAAALTAFGVEHTIVSDPRKTDWKAVDRIDQLAVYRNVAIEPMRANPDAGWGDVVFINDVYVCPGDVLELLFQRKAQQADAACGMDWRATKGWGHRWRDGVKFYDNWVSRSIRGGMLRARVDAFAELRNGIDELWDQPGEEYSRQRFQQGLPVPVYSCWNGMLSLTAEPFTSTASSPRYDTLSPNSREPWRRPPPVQVNRPVEFRSALNHMGECAASECKTLAKDFWSRGYDRWVIVPTVRATYTLSTYSHPQLLDLVSRNPPAQSTLSISTEEPPMSSSSPEPHERIRWSDLTPPQEIICWGWVRGFHLDLEILRGTWEQPWAFARSLVSAAQP
ncbi:hypothetical protein JCM8202_004289 [Rhodotorula sphaerocarpa]